MVDYLKLGDVISPKGASIIFGKTIDDSLLGVEPNGDTFAPYTVVITEEDDLLTANDVTYVDQSGNTQTVQDAIDDVYQVAANATPTLITEMTRLPSGADSYTLTKSFSTDSMLVFYNGLLLNETIHYTFNMNKITLIDFEAETNDILTVVGLGSGGSGTGTGGLVPGGIYTFDCGTADDVMEGGFLWQSQN